MENKKIDSNIVDKDVIKEEPKQSNLNGDQKIKKRFKGAKKQKNISKVEDKNHFSSVSSDYSGILKVGTYKNLNNNHSSALGIEIIEKDRGYINISSAFKNVSDAKTFDEKQSIRDLLNRPGFLGKSVLAQLPRTLNSNKAISTKDDLGLAVDRLSLAGVNSSFGLTPDVIKLNLSFNISGRIPRTHNNKYKTFDVVNGTGTTSVVTPHRFNVLTYSHFTSDNHSNNEIIANYQQNKKYSTELGRLMFNTESGVNNLSYSSDFSSLDQKIAFKKAFSSLLEFYKNNSEFRLHDLVSDSKLFFSLTDSAIQTATFLKIFVDHLQIVLDNAEILCSKNGLIDEGTRFLLTRNQNERKQIQIFIEDINDFLKYVPINNGLYKIWKENFHIGKLFDLDPSHEFNPILIPYFVIQFEKDDIPLFDGSNNGSIHMKSNLNQASVRGNLHNLFTGLISKIDSFSLMVKGDAPDLGTINYSRLSTRTFGSKVKKVNTNGKSYASLSPGLLTHFALSILITEIKTGEISSLLRNYLLKTFSLWSHFKTGKIFENSGFEFSSVSNLNYTSFKNINDLQNSKLKYYLEDLELETNNRKVSFITLDDLNNNDLIKKQNVHIYSELEESHFQKHTKFFLVSTSSSKFELTSIFLMDSIIHPYFNSVAESEDIVLSNSIYSDIMLGGNYVFTKSSNKTLYYSPVSFNWCGMNVDFINKLNYNKVHNDSIKLASRNKKHNYLKPSNGESLVNSFQIISTPDIYFFYNLFENLNDLCSTPIFNNEFLFHSGIIPNDYITNWRAKGFLNVISFDNSYTKDLFSPKDIKSYYEVPISEIDRNFKI